MEMWDERVPRPDMGIGVGEGLGHMQPHPDHGPRAAGFGPILQLVKVPDHLDGLFLGQSPPSIAASPGDHEGPDDPPPVLRQ